MKKLSSDYIFHFTSKKDSLLSILENGFSPTYCHELYHLNDKKADFYFPMICFCDVPIKDSDIQMQSYGNYAIGLNKNWAKMNGLSPLFYFERNSRIAELLNNQLDSSINLTKNFFHYIETLQPENRTTKELVDIQQTLFRQNDESKEFFRHVKNYEADLHRYGKETITNYRFYDEKEWRFVPPYHEKKVKWNLTEEEYRNYRGDGAKPLSREYVLKFNSADVEYLIVENPNEIQTIVNWIMSTPEFWNVEKSPENIISKIKVYSDLINKI